MPDCSLPVATVLGHSPLYWEHCVGNEESPEFLGGSESDHQKTQHNNGIDQDRRTCGRKSHAANQPLRNCSFDYLDMSHVLLGRLARWTRGLFVPEGRLIIAQRFIAGYAIRSTPRSPGGTTDWWRLGGRRARNSRQSSLTGLTFGNRNLVTQR